MYVIDLISMGVEFQVLALVNSEGIGVSDMYMSRSQYMLI